MYSITHLIFSIGIGKILNLHFLPLVIGSLFPDIDSLFPFISHRTALHSIFVVLGISLLLYPKFKNKSISFFLGCFTHLFLDSFTSVGVNTFWPIPFEYGFNIASSDIMNLIFMLTGIILILSSKTIQDILINYEPRKIRLITYSLIVFFFVFLGIFGKMELKCNGSEININNLNSSFDNKEVLVKGTICSNITYYISKTENKYEIFSLCQGNNSILVWKLESILEKPVKNTNVSVCGVYTLAYEEPEINLVKYLSYE